MRREGALGGSFAVGEGMIILEAVGLMAGKSTGACYIPRCGKTFE